MRWTSTPTIERIRTSPIAMYDFFCFMMPVLTGAHRSMFRVFNELHVGGMNRTGASRSADYTDYADKKTPRLSDGERVPHSSGEGLLLLFVIAVARFALGLQRVELCALLGREDRADLRVLRVAKLLHLRALRLHRGAERVELRRVVRIFRVLELLARLLLRFEEGLVRLAEVLVEVRDLRLLGIGEVQLLRVHLAETAAVLAPTALPFFAVVNGGEGQRCAQRKHYAENCHCRNRLFLHEFSFGSLPQLDCWTCDETIRARRLFQPEHELHVRVTKRTQADAARAQTCIEHSRGSRSRQAALRPHRQP